jgi:plastocyanin
LKIDMKMLTGLSVCLIAIAFFVLPAYAAGNTTSQNAAGSMGKSGASENKTVVVDIIAKDMKFNTSTITVPAGAKVTMNFDNQDSGIPHNVAVYDDKTAKTAIYKGEIITGPKKTTYTFTAPSKAGTYYFQCDVHPSMNGQFIVK